MNSNQISSWPLSKFKLSLASCSRSIKTDVYEFLNFRMRDALALVFLFDLLKDLSLISKLPLLLGLVLNSFVEVTWVNLLFLPLTFGESGSRPIIQIL